MADRVVLFIDAQNVYHGARQCFFARDGLRHTDGQADPIALGSLICARAPLGLTRTVSEVRVYSGRPDSTRQARAYAAHMRQCAAWARAGVTVIPRTLRYPPNWPRQPAQEKGIDVQLAIDFVAGAIDGRYEVGVIFSTDTDLRPALEFVADRFQQYPRAETVAWRGPSGSRALRVANPRSTWCHYLDFADYQSVWDNTDYNVP